MVDGVKEQNEIFRIRIGGLTVKPLEERAALAAEKAARSKARADALAARVRDRRAKDETVLLIALGTLLRQAYENDPELRKQTLAGAKTLSDRHRQLVEKDLAKFSA
jgi:hypothetical protein